MYRYEEQRASIFTEEGLVRYIRIRDQVKKLLAAAGAIRMQEAIAGTTGNDWDRIACVDRMVEVGELREITPKFGEPNYPPGQYRVFVSAVN